MEWWNHVAISKVEKGETSTLELYDDQMMTELPERIWASNTLEELVIWNCPNLVIPSHRSGLRALRHLGWLHQGGAPLPDWANSVTLDIDWSTWVIGRERLKADQVRGLHIGRQDEPSGSWPTGTLARLEVVGLDNSRRGKLIRAIIDWNANSLRDLRLYGCAHWSNEVAKCAWLRTLWVSGSPLKLLPSNLHSLAMLRELHWHDGALRALPTSLDGWPQLAVLNVAGNHLRSLPDGLARLRELQSLNVWRNPLLSLPDTLAGHRSLEYILAPETALTSLPDWLFCLPQLRFLDVSRLQSAVTPRRWILPQVIVDASDALYLDLDSDDVADPPPEVVARGLSAIKTHIRQSIEHGKDFLTEAKLLIVGEAGAGKTTLARRLIDPEAAMPSDAETTQGIDVRRWQVVGVVQARGRAEPRSIDVNIWDFGGQEIYHATHQFFLSRRAVYVLVADCRQEDTDFYEWLRRVAFFGHDSPVLIVFNERAGRRRQIDLARLRAQFSTLVGAVTADLSTRDGIAAVRFQVEQQIRGLPHLSERLPKSWRAVRDRLETLRRGQSDYISQREYFDLCGEHGFVDRQDKLILSQFLHDIGVCLHFQHVPALMETVILEPEWGTDAVYRVLDAASIADAGGHFSFADVQELWWEQRYAHKHSELLALMAQFELCYPLLGGSDHIAPQLLCVEQPDYRLPNSPTLTIRYRYDFMPKGIVSKFIVIAHDLIANQDQVWRHGVVLRRGEAWAEVIEEYPLRQIRIRVVGADRQALLGIIDLHLERIHARFERALSYETFVPCPCPKCASSAQPHEFAVGRLLKYAQASKEVMCETSWTTHDPHLLLSRVLPGRGRPDGFRREGPVDHAPAREVYVSYAWSSRESHALVDQLAQRCRSEGIALRHDRDEVRYKQSFAPFIEALGRGRCVVVMLSRAYFKSLACMSELLLLAEHPDFIERVFPVHAELRLHLDELALDAEIYWQGEFARLDEKLKGLDALAANKYIDGMKQRAQIRDHIGELHGILATLNALPDVVHGTADFDGLMTALRERLVAAR